MLGDRNPFQHVGTCVAQQALSHGLGPPVVSCCWPLRTCQTAQMQLKTQTEMLLFLLSCELKLHVEHGNLAGCKQGVWPPCLMSWTCQRQQPPEACIPNMQGKIALKTQSLWLLRRPRTFFCGSVPGLHKKSI